MIFAREISDPLTSLVKKVDEANGKQGKKMGSFIVVLNKDAKDKLKELAEKQGIKHTVLTTQDKAGPAGYKIAPEADVTVILYVKKKVAVNQAFRKGELKEKDVKTILSKLPTILESKKPG
jgi:hypothetical protein